MQLSDFNYELPPERIAQRPVMPRSAGRLLYLPAAAGLCDLNVRDLPALLRPGDLLVFNDTRVIPARLRGCKATGGAVEVLVERLTGPRSALAHVRASKPPRPGGRIAIGTASVRVTGRQEDLFALEMESGGDFATLLERCGEMPLPPYIGRAADEGDRDAYQTMFARSPGAVAAPTAGLHFDQALLAALRARGVVWDFITLHVGAGTFQPVRAADPERHRLHAERLTVSAALVARVGATRAAGGRVVAVGTTVVRALETAAAGAALQPFVGETRLFITPGYRFRTIDALVTNFHLPRSTLLMLVCAFGGHARVMASYRRAIVAGYRFYSYGDAMLIEPPQSGSD
ncbi:MAG: tRNA preQ1(34) S-adenosylmethionine ribosyltransferase-isomerase QueA [Gammaproteobacteria bacterium]|nr:tRNA preQ1(34) S-adenosylmethionine ribosyltransferase-isomerase QueA [Gammaproteobacteria bacterium]